MKLRRVPSPSTETNRRAHEQQQAARAASSRSLRTRLAAAAAKHGPTSIYAEMLAEHDATHHTDGTPRG